VIAYVETNFVMELAFLQREYEECIRLLELAEKENIVIAIPAYSIGEPYEKLVRRRSERIELSRRLKTELKELGRSAPYIKEASRLNDLVKLLINASEEENDRLTIIQKKLLEIADIIPTDIGVLHKALSAQQQLQLGRQDSIVFATIQQHMRMHDDMRCFINKNTRDFLSPQVQDRFKVYSCPIIPTFSDGLSYIEGQLK
jgi:predicted nucleic acid-binding protein